MIKPVITYEASCDGCGLVEQFTCKQLPAKNLPLPANWNRVSEKSGFSPLKRKTIYRKRDLCPQCDEKYKNAKRNRESLKLTDAQIAKIEEAINGFSCTKEVRD